VQTAAPELRPTGARPGWEPAASHPLRQETRGDKAFKTQQWQNAAFQLKAEYKAKKVGCSMGIAQHHYEFAQKPQYANCARRRDSLSLEFEYRI
jgi:hypothetical protein